MGERERERDVPPQYLSLNIGNVCLKYLNSTPVMIINALAKCQSEKKLYAKLHDLYTSSIYLLPRRPVAGLHRDRAVVSRWRPRQGGWHSLESSERTPT